MNILYINHYAGTPGLGMEYRPYYLAREWVRQGHEVQVLAANYSHVRAVQPKAAQQILGGIHYRWYDAPAYQGNGLGRVRNIASFLRQVWLDTPHWVTKFKPDVVIASSTYPFDIWVARRLARQAQARLVYEVHDLWPLSLIELSGMSRRHPFAMLCQKAEDDAYRDADAVVSMLPKVAQHMSSRGLDLKKLHIVPNGIALDDWQLEPQALRDDVTQALAQARADGALVVAYAGSMGLPNALDTLLDAAALLRSEPQPAMRFVLVGSGHEHERLLRRARQENLRNVCFLPPIPKAQIPSFLAAADVAYIGWQRVPIYRFGIAPNKLMDYMMAGCPVLHSVEAGNDPVAEAGAGLTVVPESAAAVVEGLRQLAALSSEQRQAMGARGREFVLQHHSYAVLAQRFLQAVA